MAHLDQIFPLSLVEIDFRPQQQSLAFMPGITFRCTSFEIINDNVVEQRQESMLVRIENTDGQITIGTPDIVIITIEDDDSKWHDSI